MESSISKLLREATNKLDELETSSPQQSAVPAASPRDPVDAEVTRLFLPYQSTSRSLTPRHRPIPRNFEARGTVAPSYSHTFCCLSKKSTTMAPNRYQKLELANAGLGERRITFQGKESCPQYFKQCLFVTFPKLSEAGGFELLRIRGSTRSRELSLISCPNTGYSVKYLKSPQAMIGHAVIYIRPLQRSLNMDQEDSESSDTTGPLIACLSCGVEFQFDAIKAHSETCNSTAENVAAVVQAGPSSVCEAITVPLPSSPGSSLPLIQSVDLTDSGEGCSYAEAGNYWRTVNDPLEAIKLFRQSVMKNSGEELHFRMDLRDSNEAREQTIISFYKRQRVDWTAPLTCTLEGDAAIGDGVKRHCLSTVMSKLQFGFEWKIGAGKTLLFEGEKDHLVPAASQVFVDSDLFVVAGRMIGHSFLHNGPCLTGLSQAVIHVLGGGMPEMASIDIKDCCDTDVREAVELGPLT
ncbi:uncharacterized protein LOC115427419 isoform X2 [Sphaeramia orbicularis]|uniref:uncharacterized protein LOC115427419 isoform X2 n=1 Tax=Sphaeramia orbicularis TaxID=375764 RepID=UPI00117D6860|nr:uncharacterized protein LOC115427419 isoform X2 [Sphaeramia orbicularis]